MKDDELTKFYDGFKDRNEAFHAALTGEDDLGAVVRAHIHIEHELREFVISAAPSPGQIKLSEMDFEETVRLALVLGLDAKLKSTLNAIGNLRNKFSHRLDMKLSKEVTKQLLAHLATPGFDWTATNLCSSCIARKPTNNSEASTT